MTLQPIKPAEESLKIETKRRKASGYQVSQSPAHTYYGLSNENMEEVNYMDMATYCKRQGMTLAQYKQYQSNIKAAAQALFDLAKSLHKTGTGMYYSINEIMTYTGQHTQQEQFLLNALAALGMEFYNDRTEWRI